MRFDIGSKVILKDDNLELPYQIGEIFEVVYNVPQTKSKAGFYRWICKGFVQQKALEYPIGQSFELIEEV